MSSAYPVSGYGRREIGTIREVAWLICGLALAFGIPLVFADVLSISRDVYYLFYIVAVLVFVGSWLHERRPPLRTMLTRGLRISVLLGILSGLVLVITVLREPATPHPHGLSFVAAILWRGVAYGIADALLLSVFPILAVFGLFESRPMRERSKRAIAGIGALALATSLVFTATYHVGYPDFRTDKLKKPMAGDVIWSLPTLATLNPIGAPIAHAALHVSAVAHSYDTDLFLPPHSATASEPVRERPELQRVLDSLVTGRFRAAPGAVAYVRGPRGAWEGAAGFADVSRRLRMTPDVRSRIGSVSKLWTATVIVKLAEQGALRLNDAVATWLPGTFPYGNRITIRQLLNHTSGMVDDNDIAARPKYWLARIHDPALRKQILALQRSSLRNPAIAISPNLELRVAAALPLLFAPGSDFHYSNIGYKTAGAIAERAGHASLASLYHRFIIDPLRLTSVGYDPTASISGTHAVGYVVEHGGKLRADAGAGEGGLAASGGIVTSARDEARFLVALVQGRIVAKPFLRQIETPALASYGLGTVARTICGRAAFTHGGATTSYMAEVAVNDDGSRVAVLMTNGRTYNSWNDDAAVQALNQLFCAA